MHSGNKRPACTNSLYCIKPELSGDAWNSEFSRESNTHARIMSRHTYASTIYYIIVFLKPTYQSETVIFEHQHAWIGLGHTAAAAAADVFCLSAEKCHHHCLWSQEGVIITIDKEGIQTNNWRFNNKTDILCPAEINNSPHTCSITHFLVAVVTCTTLCVQFMAQDSPCYSTAWWIWNQIKPLSWFYLNLHLNTNRQLKYLAICSYTWIIHDAGITVPRMMRAKIIHLSRVQENSIYTRKKPFIQFFISNLILSV